jgi:hypothetical protein
MPNWSIHLAEQTATSEMGICFKFTETSPGVFNGVIINPEVIPPDDIDEVILSEMRQEALAEFMRVLGIG